MSDRDALAREMAKKDALIAALRSDLAWHLLTGNAVQEAVATARAETLSPFAKFRDELRENARFADVDEARMQRNHADRLDRIIRALMEPPA
jgi:hypothetical protein